MTRHFHDDPEMIKLEYESDSELLIELLSDIEYPDTIDGLLHTIISTGVRGVILETALAEIKTHFRSYGQAGVLIFKLASMKGEGTFNVDFLDKEYQFNAVPYNSYITASNWIAYSQAAIIANDESTIEYLIALNDSIFELSSASYNDFDKTLVTCYQLIFTSFDAAEDQIKSLIDSLNTNTSDLYLRSHVIPALNVYASYYTNDESEINAAISNALELHKSFWGTEDKKYDPEGWISIPVIAALQFRNFKTSVDSEYIPKIILP